MLTAMWSTMIYGLFPVFMRRVPGISIASVGIIEGIAEVAKFLVKIAPFLMYLKAHGPHGPQIRT